MKTKVLTALAILMSAQLACGGRALSTPTPPPPVGASEPTSPPQAPPTEATASSSGSDVSGIVACQVVTAQEVADLAGGTVYRELEQEPSPNCIYEIDPPGEEPYYQFLVYIEPTDMVEPLIEAMPEELGDPVAGIGDVAYLEYDASAETYHLLALVRDRFGLEVIGPTEDLTKSVGELFLSRLVGP